MQPCLEGLEDAPPRAAEGALEPPGQRASGQQQPRDPGNTAATVIGDDTSHWLLTSLRLLALQPACLPRLADPAAAVQHSLLLHLEAGLECRPAGHSSGAAQPAAAGSEPEAGAVVMAAGSVLDPPLQLSSAELEVVVLAHNMQLLLQRQARLGQLVQQQQQQQQEQGTSTSADATSGGRSVCINISISFPAQPSQSSMDAVHLLLTAHERPSAAAGTGSSSSDSSSSSRRLAVLVAEVPILLMSAAAQQEVQQLLLPAMRQDVQAGLAEQQQLAAGEQLAPRPNHFAWQIMRVESTVWKHFCQLAQDILVVMRLSAEAQAAGAAGALAAGSADAGVAGTSSTAAVAAAAAAAQHAQYSTSTAVVEASAGAAAETPPALALQHLSDDLVLPLLLPFLAAHGLNNLLQQLLDCLPQQLQERWQQQQNQRLQTLAAADSSLERHQQQAAEVQEAASCSNNSDSSATEGFAAASMDQEQQQEGKPRQQKHQGSKAAGSSRGQPHPTTAAAAAAAAPSAAVAAAAAADVTSWRLPLTGFSDADIEQSYLAWKHHTLLHLDYLSAAFAVFYLAVLLRRMLREPTTIFYLLFIFIKALPHLPLVLGLRNSFLRYRELWLLLVAPACVALVAGSLLATHLLHMGRPPALLSTRAFQAYWQSRGELSTSVLRPFTMHMRLRPYAVYVAVDAGISIWAFGQVFGFAAAGVRWGFAAVVSLALCWGLEAYMRRSFSTQLLQQQHHQQRPRQQCGTAAAPGSAYEPACKDNKAP